ncbi:MAG TPA: YaaA family protein [Alloprevotella sp.]|nr:YaaA family protein [Alloprevotella sp.]
MQILLANAKIMYDRAGKATLTTPLFQSVANELAAKMALMDIDELARQLNCSRKLATENWRRYQNFHCATSMPAILAYNGQAYKHLKANTLSDETLLFGQKHLWITSFLYGLLRPMDAIVPYRMEHCVSLQTTNDKPIRLYWKEKLTDVLIDSVKSDDGILIHLSTEEYEHLFDWKRVKEEVKIVHPLFYVRQPNGTLRMQAVWAKSCRGAMVRYILENEITLPEQLRSFAYEGFRYSPDHGEELFPHFIRE